MKTKTDEREAMMFAGTDKQSLQSIIEEGISYFKKKNREMPYELKEVHIYHKLSKEDRKDLDTIEGLKIYPDRYIFSESVIFLVYEIRQNKKLEKTSGNGN